MVDFINQLSKILYNIFRIYINYDFIFYIYILVI